MGEGYVHSSLRRWPFGKGAFGGKSIKGVEVGHIRIGRGRGEKRELFSKVLKPRGHMWSQTTISGRCQVIQKGEFEQDLTLIGKRGNRGKGRVAICQRKDTPQSAYHGKNGTQKQGGERREGGI